MRSEKISSKELFNAIDQIYQEKGITKEYLIDALKTALKAAYKRDFENTHNNNENGDPENHINVIVPEDVDVDITETSIKVYAVKEVCEEVAPEEVGIKITLEDAKKISKKAKIGDSIKAEVTPKNFGRIAASTGKNILVQKIIEAEKNLVYTQYADKVGQIIVGTVQKTEKFGVIVDLGRVEALIPNNEQIKTEKLQPHQKIKALVLSVVNETGSSQPKITLSRKSPNFVKKLFENEVPEIMDGIVEIKDIAREAGSRTKISVWSNDENVDPVGSLVGKKGMRIQPIIDELNGEKIDVIPYSEDIPSYIINAISPAPILAIDINDEEKIATVVVPDDALVFAIGAGGQNVRLAAILTGWKIDIKTETQIKETVVE
ncbi:MAG: transcription termination/antitermination protein NusA [Clostridia bacterium]|nr:transcription termination/antitermination protein NusA [Clostridia bacterium]